MKQLYFIAILMISIVLISFSDHRKSPYEFETPPGTIKISDNLFFDVNEVRTLDYLEFIHWMKKVYGLQSQEYISILPDTNAWIALGKSYEKLTTNYLRQPKFRHYPVVGVNYQQASKFCKWRSDRVMEFMLIRNGVIKYNPYPTKDSIFTIENYEAGKYGKISQLKELQYYPKYTLPDSATYIKITAFADSLNNYKAIHSKNKEKIQEMIKPFYNEDALRKKDSIPLRPHPTDFYNIGAFRTNYKYELIINLKGNVAELTSAEGIAFGGSFMDKSVLINNGLFQKNTAANCYTGFRAVCTYKKLKID